MTRISAITLATLFVAASSTAVDPRSALAAEKIASKRARTTVVRVEHPTVIVFVPPQWELDAKSNDGAVEMIAHVRFAVDNVNKCKGATRIDVRTVFADRLALSLDGQRTIIDLSRKFPDTAGAYLFRSGKKPRAIATPKDTAGLGETSLLAQSVNSSISRGASVENEQPPRRVNVENRESIVKYLKTLPDKELAEIFYDAISGRQSSDVPESKRHFVLADVCCEEGKWSLDVIARDDPSEYKDGWVPGVPMSQWGICETCGSQVRSWARHMLCPVCGSKTYGS